MFIKVINAEDASNLSNLLKNGNWLVLYYAEWCGHCKDMKPEWDNVVNKFENSDISNIAEIESEYVKSLVLPPIIEGYPTIKMYNNGNEIAQFNDERNADKIEQFVINNAKPSMKKPSMKKASMKKASIKKASMKKPKQKKSRKKS